MQSAFYIFFIFIYKVNSYLGGTLYLLIRLVISILFFIESASETSAADPPQVSARQIRNKDLPAKSKPFDDCQIQVDILLLTVMKEDTCEDCEFLSCLAYLISVRFITQILATCTLETWEKMI